MTPVLTIRRYATGEHGTFSKAAATTTLGVTAWQGFILEEEWKANQPGESCIPAGRYRAILRTPENTPSTVKHMNVYELLDVPGRTAILIHAGSKHGQQATTEEWLKGCLSPGTMVGTATVGTDEETGEKNVVKGAVIRSQDALEGFHRAVGWAPEILVVIDWDPGVGEREGESLS